MIFYMLSLLMSMQTEGHVVPDEDGKFVRTRTWLVDYNISVDTRVIHGETDTPIVVYHPYHEHYFDQ